MPRKAAKEVVMIPVRGAKLEVTEGTLTGDSGDMYVLEAITKSGRGRGVKYHKSTYYIPKHLISYYKTKPEELDSDDVPEDVKASTTTAKKATKTTPTAKRKPGRPKKTEEAEAAPKKRGRPPKKDKAEAAPKKKRGRPPKKDKAEAAPKKRGRPPKKKTEAAPKKKRGRPPKKKAAASKPRSGRAEALFEDDF